MATAYSHLETIPKVVKFARQRLYEITNLMGDLKAEQQMWEEILDMLSPCQTCKGHGEIKYMSETEDGCRFKKCADCNGSGQQS